MTPKLPPPQQVPAPYTPEGPEEPTTGSHFIPATKADLRESSKETARIVTSADVKWFLGTIAVIVAGTAATIAWGSTAMDDRVHSGVAPVVAQTAKLDERLTKVETAVQQQALEQVRATVMLENLSRDRGLPVPAPAPRVPMPDGGAP